jgi:hypothetical protein
MEYGKFYQYKTWKYITEWRFSKYTANSADGLTLLFRECAENKDIKDMYDMKIKFTSADVRFRITSEFYQPVFEDWKDSQKDSFFLTEETWDSPLYIVEGSDFLKDLKAESGDMFNFFDRHLKHYYVDDTEQVIDVISTKSPTIEIYNGSELIECVEGQAHNKLYNLDGIPKSI